METKTYYAEDMPAAMEQIKREMGADALIIKSRKFKQKYGPLGLLRKDMYEVVVSCEPEQALPPRREPPREAPLPKPAPSYSAAAYARAPYAGAPYAGAAYAAAAPRQEEPPAPAAAPKEAPAQPAEPPQPVQPERFAQLVQMSGLRLDAQTEAADMLRVLSAGQVAEQPAAVTPAAKLGAYAAASLKGSALEPARPQEAPAQPGQGAAPAQGAQPAAPVKRGRGRPRKYPLPEQAASGAQGPVKTQGPANAGAAANAAERQAMARLDALESMVRELCQKLQGETPVKPGALQEPAVKRGALGGEPSLSALLARLAERDVDKPALEALRAAAQERLAEDGDLSDYDALAQALEELLGKPRYVRASKNRPRCILFVGPTGVGKTTTLVKLVSSCVFERGAKAAIINADVFRVGAQDQLSAYARILNVPMTTIYDSSEITQAIAAYKEEDFVFIDTSGKAPQDPDYQGELSRLIELGNIPEIYLTVSSTTSGRVCRQIVKEYDGLGQYRVLVTKLDESGTYGAAVNLCHASGRPLSYITTGQNVPDDIQRAEPGEIIACLLR